MFLFSLFVFYSFQYTDLSNPLLRNFDRFLSSFADRVMTRTYSFLSLIVKIILLESVPSFLTPVQAETKCFVHLSINSS